MSVKKLEAQPCLFEMHSGEVISKKREVILDHFSLLKHQDILDYFFFLAAFFAFLAAFLAGFFAITF
jgi:hypothetical protein